MILCNDLVWGVPNHGTHIPKVTRLLPEYNSHLQGFQSYSKKTLQDLKIVLMIIFGRFLNLVNLGA